MRTFSSSLAIAALALVAACGSSSSSNTPGTGRSPSTGGQCPAGSTSGQTCSGEAAFNSCIMTACGAQYQACFGSNYASGNFAGSTCADFLTCELKCPCDATAKTCEYLCYTQYAAVGSACSNALLALGVCAAANTAPTGACVSPSCTGGTSTDTSTLTSTGLPTSTTTTTSTGLPTSTSTSTATGANCAAVAACCARMTNPSIQAQCQQAIPAMNNDEALCGAALGPLQTYCPTSVPTNTSTSTATGLPTNTTTSTSTSTATGANCAAVAACCARMTNPSIQAQCQQAIPAMNNDEALCGAALGPLQAYCP